jgi:DNA-binding MurR/RpiR family transcriptional regulator
MSCLALIRAARDGMSANEKKLANFILENAPLIRDYSSQQLARSVGVSQSSVVKFSQKLGYKGFTDLKLAVHESVVRQGSNVSAFPAGDDRDTAALAVKDWLFERKRNAMSSVAAINDNESLLAAVRAIDSASRVQVIGTGRAYLVAKDLALRLIDLGKPAIAEESIEVSGSCLSLLCRGDCLVVISASAQASNLVEILRPAKKAGVVVVSITEQSSGTLGAISDVRLYSVSNGGPSDISRMTVAASQQHLVDILAYTVAQRQSRNEPASLGSRKGHSA